MIRMTTVIDMTCRTVVTITVLATNTLGDFSKCLLNSFSLHRLYHDSRIEMITRTSTRDTIRGTGDSNPADLPNQIFWPKIFKFISPHFSRIRSHEYTLNQIHQQCPYNYQNQTSNTPRATTNTLLIFWQAVLMLLVRLWRIRFHVPCSSHVSWWHHFSRPCIMYIHAYEDSIRIIFVYRKLPLQFEDKIRTVNALSLFDMCKFLVILILCSVKTRLAPVNPRS